MTLEQTNGALRSLRCSGDCSGQEQRLYRKVLKGWTDMAQHRHLVCARCCPKPRRLRPDFSRDGKPGDYVPAIPSGSGWYAPMDVPPAVRELWENLPE